MTFHFGAKNKFLTQPEFNLYLLEKHSVLFNDCKNFEDFKSTAQIVWDKVIEKGDGSIAEEDGTIINLIK